MTNRRFSDFSPTEILLAPFNLAASLFELVFCIPFLGRVLKWLWNSILTLGHFLVGLVEYAAWAAGFRPQKKIRIGFLILKDEHGEPLTTMEKVLPAVEKTREVFANAQIEVVPAFSTPKRLSESGDLSEAVRWARIVQAPSTKRLLKVGCNQVATLQDFGLHGTTYQFQTLASSFNTSFRRFSGYGAPITIFVVQDLDGFGGCSLGWLSDYITVKYNSLGTTTHELGHACNLLHRKDELNLMHPSSPRQPTVHLTTWQTAMLRASRHVTRY